MTRAALLFFFVLSLFNLIGQQSIAQDLKKMNGMTITKKENVNFKEYYEIFIDQPLDHFNSTNKTFRQRIFIGFNNTAAPTVMETDGYRLENVDRPDFINEPANLLKGNMVIVEHRFYGLSIPDSLNWNFLTIQQAAYDDHHIREVLGRFLKGKWMSCGISKGGQTALAYKMYFPEDVDATILYSTPVKQSLEDKRFNKYFDSISKTVSGKKLFAFQRYAFKNKKVLLPEFSAYVKDKGDAFNKMDVETVFDYLLLEYPFSFLQNCFASQNVPDSTLLPGKVIAEIVKVVPPAFFSNSFSARLAPSFYMFYHELGYYEYDLNPVKHWLKNDTYPNNIFVPGNVTVSFNSGYLDSLNSFIKNSKKIIFIYGELDPYISTAAVIEGNKNCEKLIVKNGCHKSRISDLSKEQKEVVYGLLSAWLQWPVNK